VKSWVIVITMVMASGIASAGIIRLEQHDTVKGLLLIGCGMCALLFLRKDFRRIFLGDIDEDSEQ